MPDRLEIPYPCTGGCGTVLMNEVVYEDDAWVWWCEKCRKLKFKKPFTEFLDSSKYVNEAMAKLAMQANYTTYQFSTLTEQAATKMAAAEDRAFLFGTPLTQSVTSAHPHPRPRRVIDKPTPSLAKQDLLDAIRLLETTSIPVRVDPSLLGEL